MGSCWAEAMAWAAAEWRGGGDRVSAGRRFGVGEGQRRPGPSLVPGQVGGQHADQHVVLTRSSRWWKTARRGQVIGLDRAKVPLEAGQVLVGGHHGGRAMSAGTGCG